MQFMRATVRELFHELADVPRAERERILSQRGVGAELRAEVESLLCHDLTSAEHLDRRVSNVAEEVLRSDNNPLGRYCGPYRLIPHPNYVAVVVEGIALPLVYSAWITALVFTVLNAALLRTRLKVENNALASLT